MAPKKGRRARRGDDDSDDDLKTEASAGTEAAEAGNPPANQKKTSKRKQAKKKGKVGDWSDDEADPVTAGADGEELPGKPSTANGGFAALAEDAEEEDGPPAVLQLKPKKGRKKPVPSFAALSQEEDPEAEAEEEYQAALQPTEPRKGSGTPAAGFAALSLAEDPDAEAEEGGSEQQVEPEEATGRSAASFAALSLADDPEAEAEEEAELPQQAAAEFAALDAEENGEAPDGVGEAEEAAARAAKAQPAKKGKKGKGKGKSKFDLEDDFALPPPEIQVASVFSVQPHPNADKLKICSIDTGSVTVKVVTNAAIVTEGMKVAYAGIGCTTPGSGIKIEQTTLRGVESFGMLCSAFDLGWVDEPDGALAQLPGSAEDGSTVPAAPMEGALYGAAASAAANGAGKRDKEKGGKKDVGSADLEEDGEEVSQQADEAEELLSKGLRKKKKKKGFPDAVAADFTALGIGEEGKPLEPADASEAAEEGPAANGHRLDSEEVGPSHGDAEANGETPELLFGAKRKKSKAKAFDPDAIIAAAAGGESPMDPLPEAAPVEEAQQPAEKKKKGKKKAVFDVDAMLAEATSEAPAMGRDPPASVQEEATSAAPTDAHDASTADASAEAPQEEAPGKKGKKKKGRGEAAEEDLDALLAQFGVNTDAAADGKQGKKKKKGKAAAEEEPTAAALESEVAAETVEVATAEQPGAIEQPSSSAAAAEAGEDAEADAEADAEGDDAADADGKGLTAAQKKKQKKKAKEKAKKGGGKEEEEPGGATAAAKKGGKKESAAVRKLREEMERQRAAQEAGAKAEEERRRKEEEDARLAEEEAVRKEEERKRRKEEKSKQRAELKRQGLLKTGREKQEAERLAAMREQFLRNNPGVELPPVGEPQQKKKVVYGRKKPGARRQESGISEEALQEEAEAAQQQAEEGRLQQAQEEQEREQAEQESRAKAKEEEAATAAAAAAAVAAAAAEAADDSDDMGWEDLDEDQIKLPGQEASPEPIEEEEEEDEEEEEEEMPQAEALPNGKAKAAEMKAPEAKKPRIERPKAAAAVAAGQQEPEEAEDDAEEEEEGSSEEGSGSEEVEDESSEEESSTEYSESEDESMDSEDAREERLLAARAARAEKLKAARQAGSAEDLRSPICCILGHVDTGKTKLLDNIRRTSVQEGEAGGITQQIGATYVPGEAIRTRTEPVRKGRDFGLKLPGLLIIDTPGHESFTNLRSRGSSLCDIAILVVDIMHGLEPQTIESINLLKQKKTPFIVALNKVDRLFEWSSQPNAGIQDSLAAQKPHVGAEFEKNLQRATLNLNEQGLNVALYWKNPDPRKYVNIVPTSAITGEGIPDMLQLVVQLTQKMMAERLMYISELQCTVLEVKVIEGLGTTIDVVLVNGVLHEGDQIVLCGLQGAIVTTIRSLLTPHPLKELRVRGSYLHHKEIKAAQGIKIAAQNLETAVAGTQMLVVQKGDSVEDLKEEVMGDMVDIFKSVDKSGEGVCVQASTLGSLEALLEFLRSDAVRIPVSGINLGPVHKRDVMRASTMLEKGRRKFAVILAFDVPVTREAQEQASSTGVRIFTADIIYHLFDQFSAYLKHAKEEEQQAAAAEAVFPVILRILPTCIFNTKDPIVLGCEIDEGIAKVGTPLSVPSRGGFLLGKIASMELNHKPVDIARRGDSIALKIEATTAEESAKLYGRHFDFKDNLVSKISRKSIDLLKMHFKDDLARDDWRLVVKLKKMFGID